MASPRTKAPKPPAPTPMPIDDAAIDALFGAVPSAGTRHSPPPEPPLTEAEAEILELFPEKQKPLKPLARKINWRGCVVCGMKDALPALPDHDVCQRCAADPAAARARLATQRRILTNAQHAAASDAEAAWRALTDEERARWAAFQVLRDAEALSPDDQRRLAATRAAYSAPAHPRISDALRRYYHAAECLFWANAAEAEGTRRLDIKIAQLNVCIEDLEDQ